MATYEVEVVQLVYAVVKVEADDGESAIEACYEHPELKNIRPEDIHIEPNDWAPLADFVGEYQGLTRDATIEETVFKVEG